MENELMKKIIKIALDNNLDFDFINNLFSCKQLGEGIRNLWICFGEIRINKEGQNNTSSDILYDIEFINGEYNLITKRENN